jgi:gluconokinase
MTLPLPPARRGPWILALDVGTSSVRAQWVDAAGAPLAEDPAARAEYAWHVSDAGAMEADAEALADLCIGIIDGAVHAGRAAGIQPAAVATAVFWHGLVGIGADGRAATPLYGWGDGRARGAADGLRARLDEAAVHRRTGCFLHELYPAAKLVWLAGAAGDTLPRAWAGPGELLMLRLFGALRTSLSMASGTGLLELRRGTWDGEMLDAAGITADALPPVDDAPFRGLRPDFAARWPELAEVPWFPPLGDGACASLGMGAAGRRVGLTVGTSAAVRVLREDADAAVPDGLWCYRLDAGRTVCGRALSNGGAGYEWLRRTLLLPSPDELEARLAAMRPGAHGLAVIPRLLPERPPRGAGPETASITGMTAATGAVEIARAWLEASAGEVAGALDAVEVAFGPADEVVAGGGALNASPAWTRIIADALGRPLRLTPHAEPTLRGAALLALERIGAIGDAVALAAADDGGERMMPDAASHAVYREMRGG